MVNVGNLIFFAVIGVIILVIALSAFSYFSLKDVSITIVTAKVIPAGSDKGSYYIVYGKDQNGNPRNIEIENQFYNWSYNRDNLLHTTESQVNKTVTFECFGWENQVWEWYPMCYKEIS